MIDQIQMLRALGDAYSAEAKRANDAGNRDTAAILAHHANVHVFAANALEDYERTRFSREAG